MTHRTFRSLDQAPTLLGFTITQWAALTADTAITGGLIYAAGLPAKAAVTLLVFLVGLPAALLYVSENGGLQLGQLLLDAAWWRSAPRTLRSGDAPAARRRRGSGGLGSLLGVAGISEDGVAISADGSLTRLVSVSAVNPLALDAVEADRVSSAFAQVSARLAGGERLQLYAQAVALELGEVLARAGERCEQAAAASRSDGEPELADAIRGLGAAQECSLRDAASGISPLRMSYLVICPWRAGAHGLRRRPTRLIPDGAQLESSLRHTEGIRADLESCGLSAERLTGAAMLDVLRGRLDPRTARPTVGTLEQAGALAPDQAGFDLSVLSDELQRQLAPADVRVGRDELDIGGRLERSMYVSLAPEQTWLGWLLHAMQAPLPFTVSVHVTATERYRERLAQRRRYKRIYGVNRGVESRGRPLDPDALVHEREAAELGEELALSAGAGIYRLSVYVTIAEPGGDATVLAEVCREIARELSIASDARVQHGPFAQLPLWRSSLPLGRDAAARQRKCVSANVGDSFPLLSTSASSPDGIALGFAAPGRTLECLDPFDPVHPNHMLLINGMSGAGKTMAAILLLARAISQGARGFIIDRAGHFEFLASLIPGAASVALGATGEAINCWDVEDPGSVGAEKVDYLLALHALLLGEHHQGRDSYGLTDLESNLLGVAISDVYERCATSGERPRELLLQQRVEQRYRDEREDGSIGIAEALRNLSMRLNNYVGEGAYAYLTDRATTIPAGAPLTVFDTRSIPDAKAAAALFVICEHVKSRIAVTRAEHLTGGGPQHAWAGRSFLVIDEAWKLIERPATGRWFNEFCRRSRHYALWLVAISQQLSDFENEHGRALLANAAMRLFLRQETRELNYARDALGLSAEAIEAISNLKTVRGRYASAYLMNGTRGEASVQIAPGPWEYWLASSDPARDEPLRQDALREADGDAWQALRRLATTQTDAPQPDVSNEDGR